MVPDFDIRGLLPAGGYAVTFDQLRNSVLARGTKEFQLDGPWRQHLINQAELLVEQLWQVGITKIYLDGSFVEAKRASQRH